ncbi:asparagine synthase (glutamine-hydrolyzing) [Thalassobaculum sp.]|uniref:asparagine synthase (glutamine-hydrolyzing) n=1 Tax=Thalassobaculum sp. TaxID=2022740 RepID=UPI0032EF6510
MCGICGIVGGSSDGNAIDRMVAAMHHRGPDDRGTYRRGRLALGMTRLAIQDLSPGGHQPMASPEGDVWIVYNGEMYNAPEERRQLEALGYRFRSSSDTEVILTMYRHYGPACLPRIRGIFALAFVDLREDPDDPTVFLARDPLGVKPLLFARGADGSFVFASEMKAILASGAIAPTIEPRALRCLLEHGSVFQPDTMIRGVSMVRPAHCVTIRGGTSRVERYWRLGVDRHPELRSADYREQVEVMADTLRETVKAQLIGDVPIAALLSGGVDSATLTALMAAEIGSKVRTFSVGFGQELAIFDETDVAARFADHLGTDHTRIEVGHEMIRAELDRIVDSIDQPSIDGVNTYFVSKAAAEHVKVAISGTGGDDLFIGYPWHAQMLQQADGGDFLTDYAEAAGRFHQTFSVRDVEMIMAPTLLARSGRDVRADYQALDELSDFDTVDRITALTLRGYTNNQLLRDIDAMSMAHSLEVRVPYLDTHVIDLALSLPIDAKLAHGIPDAPMRESYRASGIKRILIDVAMPLLPPGFDQVPKRGFGLPFEHWLNGPLLDIVKSVLQPERVARTGVLNAQSMARLQAILADGKVISGWRLWLLMICQLWAERMGVEPAR